MDYVRSPLKVSLNNVAKNSESVHTLNVDGVDNPVMGEYELARDKRVAKIQEMFRPVQEAARAL
jgi:hypothetical protein